LLADGGYAPLNSWGWIERWWRQGVLLSVAAALMALADPHVLWNVGFQLSLNGYPGPGALR
jgi:predicted membrane metal-binding protein